MNSRYTLINDAGTKAEAGQLHVAALDTTTGLMWSARPLPGRHTHAAALQHCADLRLAGFTDWQLPTIAQLQTIVDHTRYSPAIDKDSFPKTPSDWFWSSTPAAWSASSVAWIVSFSSGGAGTYYHDDKAFVRAVRVAQEGE